MFNKTQLTPLEEQLFQGWAKAHGVHEEANTPDHPFDHRAHYKATNGQLTSPSEMQAHQESAVSNDPLSQLRQHLAEMNDFHKKKAVFEAQNHPDALAHHKEKAFQAVEAKVGHPIPRGLDITLAKKTDSAKK